ncbi:hypothetical protein GGX14DRAFT_389147 [Mycena pura]|uniref:Uncharacterized protein n=1 Tax=Mycena pura TaxID=153505 RepID=A0AAD6YK20_9AGAR|nr:hypothetical protein GGX14DRAFT_389147 [Mycena pura]
MVYLYCSILFNSYANFGVTSDTNFSIRMIRINAVTYENFRIRLPGAPGHPKAPATCRNASHKRAPATDEINIPEDVEVAEDRRPDLKMDEYDGVDDSDIPLSQVVADVAGKKKGRVVRKAGGGLSSVAVAEKVDVEEQEGSGAGG